MQSENLFMCRLERFLDFAHITPKNAMACETYECDTWIQVIKQD
jgi:hypothetical protein